MRILLGLACLLLGTVTMAQVPNIFQSGQTASAAAVNENFNAVDNAVNDNAQRISTVESQLHRVVDFSGDVTVIIDEPGYYVLDRDWAVNPAGDNALEIVADDVTLDFRGYLLDADAEIGIRVSGNRVTIRNGSMSGLAELYSVTTVGADTLIEGMRFTASGALTNVRFGGLRGTIRNSWLQADDDGNVIIAATGSATIQANRIRVSGHGIQTFSSTTDVLVLDNIIECGTDECVLIGGTDSIVARNTFLRNISLSAIYVTGDGNLILDNSFLNLDDTAIEVRGTSNVIRGNIASPTSGSGMSFHKDGNFYGDNLMSVSLGGTVQIDLGGNVEL